MDSPQTVMDERWLKVRSLKLTAAQWRVFVLVLSARVGMCTLYISVTAHQTGVCDVEEIPFGGKHKIRCEMIHRFAWRQIKGHRYECF